ncbi:MAG: glycosyltransferase family 9 protein [Dysgonamonadaceae bacterium]|jgi:ADP-heptose:LPS heptosyltransferase|nr:glycosyltransferase family 9 protein [Dysgonamonadaceae bacterium]
MSRTLIIRLSALGDVAMLVPVLYSAASKYPEQEFILVTKSPLLGIFEYKPSNVTVFPVYAKGEHKGLRGLFRLVGELSALKPDKIIDSHNVLRSVYIRIFFRLKGKKVGIIHKGKAEKKALTGRYNKTFFPLKTSIQRYLDVFKDTGYNFDLEFKSIFEYASRDFTLIEPVTGAKDKTWIGIAPFAKHRGKIYPLEKMEEALDTLSSKPGVKLFLFGGGKEETEFLTGWAERYPSTVCIAGKMKFPTELQLMSYLDVMLTMDSGNMHLASLVGTPVVSVWGATHPYTGFYGFGQDPDNAIQLELSCRPCSVYGNKPCFRKDYACMKDISPQMIVKRIDDVLDCHS